MKIQGSLNSAGTLPRHEADAGSRKNVAPEPRQAPEEPVVSSGASASSLSSNTPHLQADPANGQVIAQIVNDAGEVVKEIPAEELRQAALRSQEVRSRLFDESV